MSRKFTQTRSDAQTAEPERVSSESQSTDQLELERGETSEAIVDSPAPVQDGLAPTAAGNQDAAAEDNQDGDVAPPAGKRRAKTYVLWGAAALLIILIGGGVSSYQRHLQQVGAQAESGLVAEVGGKAVIPTDEKPVISTVVDETKVTQPFLANAQKGDKVLLYFQSGQAVVYRPATGQIVNMGPLEIPKPRVFLRDGRPGLIPDSISQRITAGNEFAIASRDSSPRQNYNRTVVVDVTGQRPDVASRLALLLDAEVVPLPKSESRPDADLLVIVGSESK